MAECINTGGPAFPVIDFDTVHASGLSIRDYFAAKAMAAFLPLQADYRWSIAELIQQAYETADAMLRAREQS